MSLTCYLPIHAQHLPPGLSNGSTHCAAIIVHSIMQINFSLLAVPRVRQLGAGFSPWIPRFDSWAVHMELDTVFFSEHIGFSLSVIPPILYTHFNLNNTIIIIRRTTGRRLNTFVQSNNISGIASTLFFFSRRRIKKQKILLSPSNTMKRTFRTSTL